MSPNGKKLGRPTKFNKRVALLIIDAISNGKSLISVTREVGIDNSTVYLWFADKSNMLGDIPFIEAYDRARLDGADSMADEIQQIADDVDLSKEAILKARLQTDTRRWIASKLKPRKYGDKLDMTSDGEKLEGLVIVQADSPKS